MRGIGESDADTFELSTLDGSSGFSGHVLVQIKNLNLPGGRLFGAFDVDALQATAASNGGNFLGFRMYALEGNDTLNVTELKNLERTELFGDGTAALGLPVTPALPDDDSLVGGTLSRDRYDGGRGNDTITNVDDYDTTPAATPIVQFPFVPSIVGGTGDNTLAFNPNSGGVNINVNDFKFITTTVNDDTINVSGYGPGPTGVTIDSLGGKDTITGSNFADTIRSGDGDDTVNAGGGDDTVNGGAGNDTLNGEAGKDTLLGEDGNDSLNGGDGEDVVDGGVGNDTINGGNDNDTLRGGEGDDRFVNVGGDGNDNIDGGPGTDTVDYSGGPAVVVNLAAGTATGTGTDALASIENVDGSAFADKIIGSSVNNVLNGLGGADEIQGGGGDDTIEGGDGDDKLDGEDGNDGVSGGNGADWVLGGKGDDILGGGAGDDSLYGEEGTDRLDGGAGVDTLDGGLGADTLQGGINALTTDFLYSNYDLTAQAIEDFLVIGGPAWTDNFYVQTLRFKDYGNLASPFQPQQELGPAMNATQQIDAQFELDNRNGPANVTGDRKIAFSDFDGGDGPVGDTLTFLS